MGILYRLLICLAVASPASALYHGWTINHSLSYVFDVSAAISFALVAIVCSFLTGLIAGDSATTVGNNKPAARRSGSGKRQQGEVKWFNGSKGFGFIVCDSGDELFVHFRSVQEGSKRLAPGKRVEFSIVVGKKGEEADDVVVI